MNKPASELIALADRKRLPLWAYLLMLPFALPLIVLAGWVIDTIAMMGMDR